MRKLLITLSLSAALFSASAQTKQFQPDPTAKLPFTVNVIAGQLNAYFYVLQQGGPQVISQSKTLSGFDITNYITTYQAVMDSISNSGIKVFNAFYKAGQAKWASDTLKAFKAKH